MDILIVAALVALILRKEIGAKVDRLAIWLKAKKPGNKIDYLTRMLDKRFDNLNQRFHDVENTLDTVNNSLSIRKTNLVHFSKTLEDAKAAVDVLVSNSLAPKTNQAMGYEDILQIKGTVEELAAKLSSPEAEQINATYMQSLSSLTKGVEAVLSSQERVVKVLELIVDKLNNSNST